jgi:hypothetical protein
MYKLMNKHLFLIFLIFILLLNIEEKYFFTSVNRKKIVISKNKITKPLYDHNAYKRIKKLYHNNLNKFDFIPKMEFNDKKFEITEDYIENVLTKNNKPKNYAEQLKNIYDTLKKK